MKQSVYTGDIETKISEIILTLKSLSNPKNVEGMARYGINPENTLGITIPALKAIVREVGKSHGLALKLWDSLIHEARILAALIDIPRDVTEEQMERWVKDFDSWDVCDQVCSKLFVKTSFANAKARQWCKRDEEFVKRAGFVMITALTVYDKKADDNIFLDFFDLIKEASTDERNFVKKAVNWALRQIGKRNQTLRREAVRLAHEIYDIRTKSSKWIACDALRELGKYGN
ncbi:MAG: DNA alkylation repair protein [Nitrospirae bacterium]|nr:DNA alkylation repair protein [Nitrospirota bacterium]MBF0535521.1 DNA alkylation repair protein [Nitrospirota bacterium]MBF0617452.1 DNA alkylation repair protein [Nitrospirota bacterium]